ncbi:electron transfer flavoprotein subunit alpha/FixB family protein [candidate division WOR-3 bacterium]|uniref:Electron transfer flavoprotein subunit alpha/FixB family protein n=1 Tax=candidate division WOR-3 bacterium TaxID=2052148 RepID=A0A937XDH6_UNCW3|nr:electron transfer flavoprotein subunit alpha/FixB family protein [candidate division WOR-3 bacterium]
MSNSIMVLVEHRQGAIRDVSFEMLTAARKLGAGNVEAVLMAESCDLLAPAIAPHANKVVCVSGPIFRDFNYEPYQKALVKLAAERKPAAILIANSAFGTDLGPSLAVALNAGLVSDAVACTKADSGFSVSRGMYAGKLVADWAVRSEPSVIMVRQSNFKAEPASLGGTVEKWDAGDVVSGAKTKFLSLEEVPTTGIDITKATIVVGIGRGIKEAKNMPLAQEFAQDIGAVLAASRPVVDAGWLPKEVQIGSSGKTIKPKLYIALGISGAFQHIAGMKGADTIIAVNKDPKAPIFSVAHYGIVDDLHKVVPALRTKIKEMKT